MTTTTRLPTHGLRFYPKAHRYKLDGAWVPSPTGIIGVLNKPALPRWAAKSVAEYVAGNHDAVEHLYAMGAGPMVAALKDVPWQQRDEAANRGTEVHALAEALAQGHEVDVPDALVGHVESCLDFLDDYSIRPVLVEATVGSRAHQYAGRLDLVADSDRAGHRAIWDYKTSKSGIYPETAWQLAAYAFADFHGEDGNEHPMADLGIEASYGVHIRADGYDVHRLEFGPHVFEQFLTLRSVYDFKATAEGDWKVPGSGYVGAAEQNGSVLFENAGGAL